MSLINQDLANLRVEDPIERHYIDITTNQINSNSGVVGENNRFTVYPRLVLDDGKDYTVEIIEFSYTNIASPIDAKPIILCDLSEPINVNNVTSSILYKSNIYTGNTDKVETNISNNVNYKRNLKRKIINSVNIEIVSSLNGSPFPFDPASFLTLVLLIQSK